MNEFAKQEEEIFLAGDQIDLAKITAQYCEIPETVEVTVPVGDRICLMKFKPMPRRAEYDAMVKHHIGYFNQLPKVGTPAHKAHEWEKFWPQSANEYVEAATIAELSVDPKITVETALVWLSNPTLTKNIIDQLEMKSKTVYASWQVAGMELQKKTLKQTRLEGTSSESASSTGDSQAS